MGQGLLTDGQAGNLKAVPCCFLLYERLRQCRSFQENGIFLPDCYENITKIQLK